MGIVQKEKRLANTINVRRRELDKLRSKDANPNEHWSDFIIY